MSIFNLSLSRISAVMMKEFIQMRRDRATFAMMIALPVMQLLMFGFAINNDPRHLPMALIDRDHSSFSRTIVKGIENATYMDVVAYPETEKKAEELMRKGKINFIMIIPENFKRNMVRGEQPQILLLADASDPSASSGAVGAMNKIVNKAMIRELSGALIKLSPAPPTIDVIIHRRYNPAGITQFNIVPGLLGIILAMTMTMMTAVAITREAERGTLENLLAMPIRSIEMMVGKIAPYIFIGYIQMMIVLIMALSLFNIPFMGSFTVLLAGVTLYILANLIIGFLFSTMAKSQMQAMQFSFFLLLPQILLSGFMFPFLGMPKWAQYIGEILPATHFMRLVRGIILKGVSAQDLFVNIWPLLIIMAVTGGFAMIRYRQTLD